jgi:hypothetical protein
MWQVRPPVHFPPHFSVSSPHPLMFNLPKAFTRHATSKIPLAVNPFRMNTCATDSIKSTYSASNLFRMNTFSKQGGGGVSFRRLPRHRFLPPPELTSLLLGELLFPIRRRPLLASPQIQNCRLPFQRPAGYRRPSFRLRAIWSPGTGHWPPPTAPTASLRQRKTWSKVTLDQ